mmetsp:Transcript_36935/g.56562  ORF Transcript_36935/g.56562 Transcript_36935/m.56562 type:complete len:80 (+) Transcript_36935:471-710(+)
MNYFLKGLSRVFEEDLDAQTSKFKTVFVHLFYFLKDLKFIGVPQFFDELMIMFSRYYILYVPHILQESLIPFKSLDNYS